MSDKPSDKCHALNYNKSLLNALIGWIKIFIVKIYYKHTSLNVLLKFLKNGLLPYSPHINLHKKILHTNR